MRRLILLFFILLIPFSASARTSSPLERQIKAAEKKEAAGDYERAQSLYEGLLKHHPDYAPALLGLGNVQYWQGDYEASRQTYQKLLNYDPENAAAMVGIGKAYLAVGKERKAEKYLKMAKQKDPENEAAEAVGPQLKKDAKINILFGFISELLNYAPDSYGEFQEITIDVEKRFGAKLNNTNLRRFGLTSTGTEISGYIFPVESTRLEAGIAFAPQATVIPHQSYRVGLRQSVSILDLDVVYHFADFVQANTHNLRPGLFLRPHRLVRLGGGYDYQHLDFGASSQDFHGGFAEIHLGSPFNWLSFHGFYENLRRSFEAGRPGGAFLNYTANAGGGGIHLDFTASYAFHFDIRHESRSNGDAHTAYALSFGYSF